MDRLHAMITFVKAADVGSFAEASRQLNASPAAVTRAIANLEHSIGARLFVRTTRTIKLTEAGTRYLDDCRRILHDIGEAEAVAAGAFATPHGLLSVTASALFGQLYVLPVLIEYLSIYPGVRGRTLFVDRITNIIDEGIDIAIRIGNLPDSSFSAVRVGTVRRLVCGSPDYFNRHGIPKVPADLVSHRIIAATPAWASPEWRFGRDEIATVTLAPALNCNTNDAAISAAIAGFGLTRVLSYQIGPDLIEGRLQTVLSDWEEAPLPVHVVFADGRRASAKVRTFVDLAVDRLRANPIFN